MSSANFSNLDGVSKSLPEFPHQSVQSVTDAKKRLSLPTVISGALKPSKPLRPLNAYQFATQIEKKEDKERFEASVKALSAMTGSNFFPAFVAKSGETLFNLIVGQVQQKGWFAKRIASLSGLFDKPSLIQCIFMVGAANLVKAAHAAQVNCTSPAAIGGFLLRKIEEELAKVKGGSEKEFKDAADAILRVFFPEGHNDLPDGIYGRKGLAHKLLREQLAKGLINYKELQVVGATYVDKCRQDQAATVKEATTWMDGMLGQLATQTASDVNSDSMAEKAFHWVGAMPDPSGQMGSKKWMAEELKGAVKGFLENPALKQLLLPFVVHLHRVKSRTDDQNAKSLTIVLFEKGLRYVEEFLVNQHKVLNLAVNDKEKDPVKFAANFRPLVENLFKVVGLERNDFPLPAPLLQELREKGSLRVCRFLAAQYHEVQMPVVDKHDVVREEQYLVLVPSELHQKVGNEMVMACEKDVDLVVNVGIKNLESILGYPEDQHLESLYLKFVMKALLLPLLVNAVANVGMGNKSHKEALNRLTAEVGLVVQRWVQVNAALIKMVAKGPSEGSEELYREQVVEAFKDLAQEFNCILLPPGGTHENLQFPGLPFANLLRNRWESIWKTTVPNILVDVVQSQAVPLSKTYQAQMSERLSARREGASSATAKEVANALVRQLPVLAKKNEAAVGTLLYKEMVKAVAGKGEELERVLAEHPVSLSQFLGNTFVTVMEDPSLHELSQSEKENLLVSFIHPVLDNLENARRNEVLSPQLTLAVLASAKKHVVAVKKVQQDSDDALKDIHARVVKLNGFKRAEEKRLKELKGKWIQDKRAIRSCQARIIATIGQLEMAKNREKKELHALLERSVDRALLLAHIRGPEDLPIPPGQQAKLFPLLKKKMVEKLEQALDRIVDPRFAQKMIQNQLLEDHKGGKVSKKQEEETFSFSTPVQGALDGLLSELGEFLPPTWAKRVLQNEQDRKELSIEIADQLNRLLETFDLNKLVAQQINELQSPQGAVQKPVVERLISQAELKKKMVVAAREKILDKTAKRFDDFWRVTIKTEYTELEEDDQEALIKAGEVASTSVFALTFCLIGKLFKPLVVKIIDCVVSKEIEQLAEAYDAQVHENLVYRILDTLSGALAKQATSEEPPPSHKASFLSR